MLNVTSIPIGELSANCYFVTSQDETAALVVDPGYESERLLKCIEDFGSEKLKYIILTHGHFDHIGYVAVLKEKYPFAKIVIGKDDKEFTENDVLNLSVFFGEPVKHFKPDITVSDHDTLDFGSNKIEIISTPGHTKGGICCRIGNSLFTGDTLLKGSMGRTDFPTGDEKEIFSSLRRIVCVNGNLTLYCGHGPATDLDTERKNNIAIRDALNEYIY